MVGKPPHARSPLRQSLAASWLLGLTLGPVAPVALAGAVLPAPYQISSQLDVVYGLGAVDNGTGQLPLQLDLYQPIDFEFETTAGIILVHGGGFRVGDKSNSTFTNIATQYAAQGFVVANINYRLARNKPLAPQDWTPFGDGKDHVRHAAVVDTRRAVRWMRANAAELGVNPHWIFLMGISAGGATAVLAGSAPDYLFFTDLPGDVPLPDNHPQVSSDVLAVVDFWGKSLSSFLSADDPPMLVLHGTDDPVVDFFYSVVLTIVGWQNSVDITLFPLMGEGHAAFDAEYQGESLADLAVDFMDEHISEVPEPNAALTLACGFGLLNALARRRSRRAARS